MVESALEFLDVCEAENYLDVVFSMKASNAQVAIQAYRLLAARLEARSPGAPGYPFHVGVTEAGDGEDGRIKSAIGIGALLEDGLGDTIRVSLTEDPVKEVPVAAALARPRRAALGARAERRPIRARRSADDPYSHRRRSTRSLGDLAARTPCASSSRSARCPPTRVPRERARNLAREPARGVVRGSVLRRPRRARPGATRRAPPGACASERSRCRSRCAPSRGSRWRTQRARRDSS
jgi:4-hydroxy-3-methylbut-2-en-1-yl diphosphate synthase IspG/GcpE